MQMTRTEVSRDFSVSESLLSSYEASGLIWCPHGTDGEPIDQEQEVRSVGLIRSLLDTGMEQDALQMTAVIFAVMRDNKLYKPVLPAAPSIRTHICEQCWRSSILLY